MRSRRLLGFSMALVFLLSLQGCLFGIIDLRLRSHEMEPIKLGFKASNELVAKRLVPYVQGSGGIKNNPSYGRWRTNYRGGDSFAAVMNWASHSLTALIRVRNGQVELTVLESEGLNEDDGQIHKVAVGHLKALRRTLDRGVRLERTTARLTPRKKPRTASARAQTPKTSRKSKASKKPRQATSSSTSARPARKKAPAPQVARTRKSAESKLSPSRALDRAPSIEGLKFGNYYALVIGNNRYADLPNLRTPVPDAAVVSSLLELDYGFDVEILADATRSDIVMALNRYRGRLGAEDNLLVYYAGHGWFDEEASRGYWLPVDAKQNDPSNWLSNATITDLIRVIPAKHVMIVADSCYSGTLTRGISIRPQGNNYLKRMATKRARTVLTSGGLEPVEDGTGKHSVFAGAIIGTLRENRSVIDGLNLFNSIRHEVLLESDQTPEYGDMRRAGHDGGDFLFVRRPYAE